MSTTAGGKALFVSQLPLGRCENMTALYEAYDGPKEFKNDVGAMRDAERDGYAVVVCDCLPVYIEGKERVKSVNIGHGITGDKRYAADEKYKPWYDQRAADQIDYAIATSASGVDIVANQFLIPRERVLPLGMPRTDAYFNAATERARDVSKRVYLYAPTFRNDDGWLPNINWAKVDRLLGDDETMVVKRHYFTRKELTRGHDLEFGRVVEIPFDMPSEGFIRACDVLLTDYSSIMFDAYLLGKPVVLACDDMREYLAKRGMYYEYPDFYSSWWMDVEGHEELLVTALRSAAKKGMNDRARECVETVAGACDGHSCERVCELISGIVNGDR